VRYLVLGCGAIGGTVAAGLARDGHDITVCDADPAVVRAVLKRGLRIEGPVEQFTAMVPAIGPADLPDRIDGPVLLAVKAHHTAAAAALLAPRLAPGAFVVSLQNGLNAEVIAAAVGPSRSFFGSVRQCLHCRLQRHDPACCRRKVRWSEHALSQCGRRRRWHELRYQVRREFEQGMCLAVAESSVVPEVIRIIVGHSRIPSECRPAANVLVA